jgi:hypothetical protein
VRRQLAQGDEGSFRAASPIDGVPRLVSFRAVEGLPLLVAVGQAEGSLLAGWRRFAIVSGSGRHPDHHPEPPAGARAAGSGPPARRLCPDDGGRQRQRHAGLGATPCDRAALYDEGRGHGDGAGAQPGVRLRQASRRRPADREHGGRWHFRAPRLPAAPHPADELRDVRSRRSPDELRAGSP